MLGTYVYHFQNGFGFAQQPTETESLLLVDIGANKFKWQSATASGYSNGSLLLQKCTYIDKECLAPLNIGNPFRTLI